MKTSAKKHTISSTCRSMIIAGRGDNQIWATLRRIFKIDESKRYYISWYRAEVRRKGLLRDRRKAKKSVEADGRRSTYRYATMH